MPRTIASLAQALLDGRTTARALLSECLAAADKHRALGLVISTRAEPALAEADEADARRLAGRAVGPLDGIPFAIKDIFDVAGLPTRAGSALTEDAPAASDAAIVVALRRQGAIPLAKLATWEYGTGNGGEYFDLPFPPARNPWSPDRFGGGSSSGSGAAVAAGIVPLAIGSDTTGSVRIPAAATGTCGLVASPGVLDMDGALPNTWSLDRPGIFTWTAEDAALALGALSGGLSPASEGRALRIGVVGDPGPGMGPPEREIAEAFQTAVAVLRDAGIECDEVGLPVSVADCFAATRMIGPAESASLHEQELRERPDVMGRALREKLMAGQAVRAVDYLAALRFRTVAAEAIDALVRRFDAIVTFGTLHLPPLLGVEPEMTRYTVDTMMTPFNLSGHPAMVQCTGFSSGGLPLSWQIVGRRGGEGAMLDVSRIYEGRTPWRDRRPQL